MGLPGRQDTPGQPMDPIGLASVLPSHVIGDTRNTRLPIVEDGDTRNTRLPPIEDWSPESQRRLLREGPFHIADYLAQNSSKSAAVFRRYDKLAIHRLITLSKDLRRLEKEHDRYLEDGVEVEDPSREIAFSHQVGGKVLEYCTRLLHIRTIEGTC